MLANDVQLLPASIDPFMREGPALHWFRYGNAKKTFDLSSHDFGHAQGTKAGIAMSKQSLEDGDICGVIHKADITWKLLHHGNRLFSDTYKDRTPSNWSSQFLATRYTWAFAQHIILCQHRNNQHLRGLNELGVSAITIPNSARDRHWTAGGS
eukprot:9548775-Ditylum_brightwellii.AAC.1